MHQQIVRVTNRLVLRWFNKDDADDIVRLCNNIQLYKSTLNLPYPYRREDAWKWMANHQLDFVNNRKYELALTLKESGELIGAIALSHHPHFHHGELAYWVGEPYWGNGYATEAAQFMIEFAFQEKDMHKVFARCFTTNQASVRVLEKVGMKQEGILLDHVYKDNQYVDLMHFGILNRKNVK